MHERIHLHYWHNENLPQIGYCDTIFMTFPVTYLYAYMNIARSEKTTKTLVY